MKNLRSSLIRLAHENPELRSDLLPLLKEATVPGLEDIQAPIPKSIHFTLIHGVKYALSRLWPGGGFEDDSEDDPLAETLAGHNPWVYLWVLDEDRQRLIMWRSVDGSLLHMGPVRSNRPLMMKLEKKHSINAVDHQTALLITREMSRRNARALEALRKTQELPSI